MKKNVIMLLVTIIAAILVMIGIVVSKKTKDTNEIQESTDYNVEIKESTSSGLIENKSEYDYDNLEKLEDLKDLEGKIIDVANNGSKLFACTSNKVYSYNYSEFEEVLTANKTIKSIFWISSDIVVLENYDNTYSIYVKKYETTNTGNVATFFEINGIDITNTIYIANSINSSSLILIKNDNNNYFVDMYDLDSNLNIKSKNLRLQLHLALGINTIQEVDNIKEIYVEDESKLVITLSDGKLYTSGTSLSFSEITNGYIKLYMEGTIEEELSEVNKVYARGSSLKYSRPLFEKIGDSKNIYTYKVSYPVVLIGNPNEQDKITITLPNNYTTDNIKNVLFAEDLIIEFNDKNIYVAKNDNLSELILSENLSLLNQNGKIKDIVQEKSNFVVLMDDLNLYEIDIK